LQAGAASPVVGHAGSGLQRFAHGGVRRGTAVARDELVTSARYPSGETIPYLLTTKDGSTPRYGVILMPGGAGVLNPRIQNGKLVMSMGGNFLIRSRELFADRQFIAVSSDASSTPARMLAIVQDVERRYGKIAIYLVGTSRSTDVTMALSGPLDGRVAGFVHTSSMNGIATFDPRKFKSRHLIVYHRLDACRATKPSAGVSSHRNYGTELIEMEGGTSVGDDCEAYAHHGYNGVEKATVDRIKAWIANGK
jgi:hypothetical protein